MHTLTKDGISVVALNKLHQKSKAIDTYLDDRIDLSTTRVAWGEITDNVERGAFPCSDSVPDDRSEPCTGQRQARGRHSSRTSSPMSSSPWRTLRCVLCRVCMRLDMQDVWNATGGARPDPQTGPGRPEGSYYSPRRLRREHSPAPEASIPEEVPRSRSPYIIHAMAALSPRMRGTD